MGNKRLYSKRHIKILALQRCSRAIALVTGQGLYVPDGFPKYGADYPYATELDLECNEIARQLRMRLAALALREFADQQIDHLIYEDSDNITIK